MAKLLKCLVCGTRYKYCNTCSGYNPNETWRFLFDKQECYDIYNEWQKYHSNVVDADGFKELLKDFDLTEILSDNTDTMISSAIKGVFLNKEDLKQENEKEENVQSTEESSDKVDSIKKAEDFMNSDRKNNFHKNKKNNKTV